MRSVEKSAKTVEEAVQLALRELGCAREEASIEVLEEPGKRLFGILGSREARVRVTRKENAEAGGGEKEGKPVQRPSAAPEAEKEALAGEAGAGAPGKDQGGKAGAAKEDGGKGESGKTERGKEAGGKGDSAKEDSVKENGAKENGAKEVEYCTDKTARFLMDVTALMGIEAKVQKREEEESIRYELSGPHMGSVIGRRGDTLDALQYLANIIANRDKEEPRKRILLDAEDYRKRREETLVRLAHRLAARVKRSGHRVVLEPMSPMERRVIHTALQGDPEIKTLSEGEEPYRRLVISLADSSGSSRGYGRRRSYDRGSYGYGGEKGRYTTSQREGGQKRYNSWEDSDSDSDGEGSQE